MDIRTLPRSGYFAKLPIPIRAVKVTEPVTIQTLEGPVELQPADNYVVYGVHGEPYAYEGTAFRRNYERAEKFGPEHWVKKPQALYAVVTQLAEEYLIDFGNGPKSIWSSPGDYIITRDDGVKYPCKPAAFADSYMFISAEEPTFEVVLAALAPHRQALGLD